MYQDYKDLLSAFQSHGVEYLVVGGFAVIYHSQPRFTKDLDLFIKSDTANAKQSMRPLRTSERRSKAFGPTTSPNVTTSFGLDVTLKASIFFPTFPASISTRHGKGALRSWLTRTPARKRILFQPTIS